MKSMLRFGYQYQDSGTERDLRKRRRLLGQLQNVCPHIVGMDPAQAEPGHTAMENYAFETHFGTLDYFCICRARRPETTHRYRHPGLLLHVLALRSMRSVMHATQCDHERMSRAFHRDPNGTLSDIVKAKREADKLVQKLNRLGGAP